MRVLCIGLLLAAAVGVRAGAPAAAPTLRVVIEYPGSSAPSGAQVGLRGDGLGLSWSESLPAERVGQDQWAVDLRLPAGSDAPTNVSMKPMMDGAWCKGQNFVVDLSSGLGVVVLHPWFWASSQLAILGGVWSPQLGNTRDVILYLPGAAVENPLRRFSGADVLVAHDGQNLFNASTSAFGTAWMMQNTADPDIDAGRARPYIIVGVYNTANRTYEYTPQPDPTVGDGGGADLLLDFYEQTVYPLVASVLNVEPPPRRGTPPPAAGEEDLRWPMLGSSLGGLLSCYAAWTRPGVYGKAGCMSSSFWWDGEHFLNATLAKASPATAPPVDWYVDSGDSGPDNDDEAQTLRVYNRMQQLGYEPGQLPDAAASARGSVWHYVQPGGRHNEKYWGERFYIPERLLLGPKVLRPTPLA
ncbi:hypothetical protein FNF27_04594 [Cafeteria roenbergensis]|uniref:Esterase n=1 Tax=Cafeteria roenbergensis TaxID=33653 RepID=A0A5A8EAU2_CAFRO|nr:hypothetical protein FNF27_04594 [Cafeteria roenbergensis]